ncbi:MAG: replication initiator protein A [Bdellovibrionota bacterium]
MGATSQHALARAGLLADSALFTETGFLSEEGVRAELARRRDTVDDPHSGSATARGTDNEHQRPELSSSRSGRFESNLPSHTNSPASVPEDSDEDIRDSVANSGLPPLSFPAMSSSGAFSRDEMNLAEFPLTVLSTRVDPNVKTLEFSDHLRTKSGEMVERKWIITAADKFGLPTSTDDDVILGLIRLSMDDGFRNRKVHFTRYELLKALRWSTEGRSYSRLTKSLDRLSGVRIRATNSFYDNSSKSYQTCNFGIIDAYEINDHRGKKGTPSLEPPPSFFIWSEMLFDSFRAGFIKKLDLDLYFQLKSAVSRRLYRYLDKHFYFRSTLEKPLLTLAFEKLGLSRNYRYVSSVRQQIEPALEELQKIGFLSSFEIGGRGEQATIRFVAAPQGAAAKFGTAPRVGKSSGSGRDVKFGGKGAIAEESGREPMADGAYTNEAYLSRSQDGSAYSSVPAAGVHPHEPSLQTGPSQASRGALPRGASSYPGKTASNAFRSSSGEVGRTPSAGRADASSSTPELRDQLIEALVSRGISISQAKRLLMGKTDTHYRAIDRIVQYYDYLVENNDPKVSRSKVGFLYRAVESPYRFAVPPTFEGAPGTSTAAIAAESARSRRPELQIFRAPEPRPSGVRRETEPDEALTAEYRNFLDQALSAGLKQLGADELSRIHSVVEQKMSCLKNVLTPERFQDAVNGCVKEELIKVLGLPGFRSWAGSAKAL